MKEDQDKVIEDAISALSKIKLSKKMKRELYEALARLMVSFAIETVALRKGENGVEIFLTQRGPNEAYAGQWHSPGSVMRSRESFQDVLDRLASREFKTQFKSCRPVGLLNYKVIERGHFIGIVFLVELQGTPNSGKWFPIKNLPTPTVEEHTNVLIPMALDSFQNADKSFVIIERETETK